MGYRYHSLKRKNSRRRQKGRGRDEDIRYLKLKFPKKSLEEVIEAYNMFGRHRDSAEVYLSINVEDTLNTQIDKHEEELRSLNIPSQRKSLKNKVASIFSKSRKI